MFKTEVKLGHSRSIESLTFEVIWSVLFLELITWLILIISTWWEIISNTWSLYTITKNRTLILNFQTRTHLYWIVKNMSENSTVNSTVLLTGPATRSDFWTSLNAIITVRTVGNSSSQSGAKETGWLVLGRSSFPFNPGAAEDGTRTGRWKDDHEQSLIVFGRGWAVLQLLGQGQDGKMAVPQSPDHNDFTLTDAYKFDCIQSCLWCPLVYIITNDILKSDFWLEKGMKTSSWSWLFRKIKNRLFKLNGWSQT